MPHERARTRDDLFRPAEPGEAVGERVVYLQGHKDRFQIVTTLAEGGMGEVFLGSRLEPEPGPVVRTVNDEWFAIKLPREDIDNESRALFLKEAEAAAKIDHPNVVKVIDWGDEPLFIVFERGRGGDLAKEISRRRGENQPWSEPELVAMFRQLVDGMRAVNVHVVHRDVKPSNVFLEGEKLRIGDFGLAKAVDASTRSLTHKGRSTPAYAAPEIWRSERYTWAADQYSLGISFFELATFQRPFKGPTNDELEQEHLYKVPPLASEIRPDLSTGLATMIARMTRKQTSERFTSWDEIEAALAGRAESASSPAAPRLNMSAIKKAAARVETVTARDLKAREEADARTRKEHDRRGLQKFWQERVHAIVDGLGGQLRAEVAGLAVDIKRDRDAIVFSSLQSELRISFTPTPPDQEEILLWGHLHLRTPKEVHFSHVLLFHSPADPYGQWREADITQHPLHGLHEEKGMTRYSGGRYCATTWPLFEGRRRARNMASTTQYAERALDWEARLPAVFETLINEAQ